MTTPIIHPINEKVTLNECPPGLFWFEDSLCFKSEYGDNYGHSEAFCVSSGEYFWGGTSDKRLREHLMVTPIDCPSAPLPPEVTPEQGKAWKESGAVMAEADKLEELIQLKMERPGVCREEALKWALEMRAVYTPASGPSPAALAAAKEIEMFNGDQRPEYIQRIAAIIDRKFPRGEDGVDRERLDWLEANKPWVHNAAEGYSPGQRYWGLACLNRETAYGFTFREAIDSARAALEGKAGKSTTELSLIPL